MSVKKTVRINKILLVSTLLSGRGGMETVIKTFVSELEKKGINVQMVFLGKYKKKKHDLTWLNGLNYKILLPNFPLKGFIRDFVEVKKLSELVIKEKPDIFIGLNNAAILHLWKVRNKTYPFKIFSWVHFALKILHNTNVLKMADYHLSISSGISQDLEKKLSIDKNKIFTIYNPVNIERQQSIIDRPLDSVASFLFVGRLTEQKDPMLLIKAVTNLTGDWKLHIVGEGHLRANMEAYAREKGVEKNIFFHGWQSNPWDYIRAKTNVSALILCSKNEGFPMVLLEGMSRGIFCIASDCETGPADIINEKNGLLFPVGDAQELQRKLQELIDSRGLHLPSQSMILKSIDKFSTSNYCERVLEALEKGIN